MLTAKSEISPGSSGLLAFPLHVRTAVAAVAGVESMAKMLENASGELSPAFAPRPLESHTELFRVTQLPELHPTFAHQCVPGRPRKLTIVRPS